MIFDIKLGENFRRKERIVGGGHMTTAPSSITFSSLVLRDLVRTALNIAALNYLDILAWDIQNAYITALCRENIWIFAGPEFGEEEGTLMLFENDIIWDKVIRHSILTQDSRSTEGHCLLVHKRGTWCMDPTGSQTRWHRIPRNGIMLCWKRISNIGNTNENYWRNQSSV